MEAIDAKADNISTVLIYPQNVTVYQVDDEFYGPAEVAQVNKFNTFLDALDGVSISASHSEQC